jgi:hypothetical protein
LCIIHIDLWLRFCLDWICLEEEKFEEKFREFGIVATSENISGAGGNNISISSVDIFIP